MENLNEENKNMNMEGVVRFFIKVTGDDNYQFDKEDSYYIDVLQKLLDTLSDREMRILTYRLGLYSSPMDLFEVHEIFGITREKIRQIEEKAYRKIRSRFENYL